MQNRGTYSLLLESLLQSTRKPVAIKFLFNKDEFNLFEANPKSNMIAYCSAVGQASKGKTFKLVAENFACFGSAMALGLIKPGKSTVSGTRRLKNGSYDDLCTSRSVSRDMVYCEHDIYGVGIVPLEKYGYKEEPDVVILITDPYDAMRVLQGYAFYYGQAKGIKMAGMQAICQECTSYPFETNSINVSMLCSGTRMMAQWARDELAIGIPFNKFIAVVNGIKNTVNPFERNDQKKIIENRLKHNGLENYLSIEYNRNYDDGGYTGLDAMKNFE